MTLIIAAACAGLFAGAAMYINLVEHPARLSCGTELAVREFAPSYRRATVMQAFLAVAGCIAALWSAWLLRDAWIAVGALLLGAVVPFTLVVILHAARSALSSAAFVVFLVRLSSR
jgi:hypothetical protein